MTALLALRENTDLTCPEFRESGPCERRGQIFRGQIFYDISCRSPRDCDCLVSDSAVRILLVDSSAGAEIG